MGAWALDFNTLAGTRTNHFDYFKGNLYAASPIAGPGLWRRDGPGAWTNVAAGLGDTHVWGDFMWGSDGTFIYRSHDGVAWVVDQDIRPLTTATTTVRCVNHAGDYLYVGARDNVPAPSETYLFRRDAAGVYTLLMPLIADNLIVPGDLLEHGSYVYFVNSGTDIRRTDDAGASWTIIKTDAAYMLELEQDGIRVMYALIVDPPGNSHWLYKFLPDDSYSTVNSSTFYAGTQAVSIAADGTLWYAGHRAAAGSVIYMRDAAVDPVPDHWSRFDTTGAALDDACSATIDDDGTVIFATDTNPEFYLWVPTYAIEPGGAGLGVGGSDGLPPQSLDVDGDGNSLYAALYTAVPNPILLKVTLPLTATSIGLRVFDPGNGDAINVKTIDVGSNLVVAGLFGNNDQVEASDDGGMTWNDVDPTTWLLETAQPLLVDPDTTDQITVGLQTAQVITETFNANVAPPPPTWTQQSPGAIGYAIAAMARLPVDGDEIVVGDAHAARKVEYSPNRGVELVDITGGAAIGNVVALEVA